MWDETGEIKKVPISTNVLTDTAKTLITVFGRNLNSDTNTIIIADYSPIVNLFAETASIGFHNGFFDLRPCKIQSDNSPHFIKAKSTVFGFVIFYQRFYLFKQFIDSFFVRTHLLHPISDFYCIIVEHHISVILRIHRCFYGKIYNDSISEFYFSNSLLYGNFQRIFFQP